ncbi:MULTISPECIES: helix-turn-helix domain-containing protein [unclassified Bradyrhizobium]|uniref:winged helix-turn-helix transcriptional regulator n=2 Tax=Bradyrhizobium TaxID=374 RepID=UPI0032E521A2
MNAGLLRRTPAFPLFACIHVHVAIAENPRFRAVHANGRAITEKFFPALYARWRDARPMAATAAIRPWSSHAKSDLHDNSYQSMIAIIHSPPSDLSMRRTSFRSMTCPIARGLDRVGEWWSILILRDAFNGLTRFDQFEDSLGIAPNMLARRLKALVAAGLLEKRRYSIHPPRFEYALTERGRDFRPVLVMLQTWGNTHFAPEGRSVITIDSRTGREARPVVIDAESGLPITDPAFRSAPGPAASERTRRRYAPRAVKETAI